MSFEEISPARRQPKWQGCGMSVTKSGQKLKIRLLLSPSVMSGLGVCAGDLIDCLKGSDDHAGQILVKKGHDFKISQTGPDVGRIDIPNIDDTITAACPTMAAAYEFISMGLLITIPKLTSKDGSGGHEK